MNFITRNKWWKIAFGVLVILNIVTLTAFWWTRKAHQPEARPPQGGAIAYLVKTLQLDSVQQEQLRSLRDEHRSQSQEIRRKNREAKEVFFNLLQKEGITEAEINQAAAISARYDAELSKITFDHFKKIRVICTPEQQQQFDEIIHDVLRMMAGPQGPPPHDSRSPGEHPDGPPPHDQPPHEK